MKTEMICCVCKKHLRWIDTPCGGISHGYCKRHYEEAMRNAEGGGQDETRGIVSVPGQGRRPGDGG